MKTKQEQIDEMIKIFTDNREVCNHMRCVECKYHGDKECMYSSYAYSLYQAGYGDVSEYKNRFEVAYKVLTETREKLTKSEHDRDRYKAEIERLKAENGQSRKLGILGNNATVEFLDDTVSEPSVECKDIEKYAKQFRNRIISINEKEIKQAKIDVLNELKDYCAKREDYKGIEQQQKEDLLRRNEERKFRPELTSDEIQFLRSGADKANGQATMANKVVEYIDRMIEELQNDD